MTMRSSSPPQMSNARGLRRLATICYRRRRRVLLAWVVLLVAVVMLNSSAGGTFRDQFELPGSESQAAIDFLNAKGFPTRAGFGGQIVFETSDGLETPGLRSRLGKLFADIERSVPDTSVVSPFDDEGRTQVAESGVIAYAQINFGERDSNAYSDASEKIKALIGEVDVPGLRIELGGDVFVEQPEFSSEGIGFLAAMIILLIAFGSLLAMGLPLLTAIFGIGTGAAIVGLVVNFIDMPSFSTQAVLMIGIGVGIDYALFIVTRYRESLGEGLEPEGAVVRAVDTAGRAVLFAGMTVVIAVLGLFAIGLSFMRGLAIGVSIGVLMTMLASVTLLPAVLGFVGRNIDRLAVPRRKKGARPREQTFWYRWSRLIQRRPWPALAVGVIVLGVLAVPLFAMRLGFGDAGNRPTSDTTRAAYDLLSSGFGPGFNGPLLLAADLPGGRADDATLGRLTETLNRTPGIAFATGAFPNEAGDAAILQVFPTTSPQEEATSALVRDLRDRVIPSLTNGTGVRVLVGGLTAAVIDFSDYISGRLPIFIGLVLILSFLLLMVVFRSLLVPLKAVIMNLLSIGAAYGVLVAVFQWGWGAGLIGVGSKGPIEAWAPMMLFAIVFGLSMDYEVFLLSRIKEDYDRSGDNASAVANGLVSTARVITAAAAIMVFVFGSFILGELRDLKLFGLGLTVAVLLDATIVRMVLVPATMELLGDRNWWLPGWLDRRLPVVHVDVVDDVDRELAELARSESAGRETSR